jgi:soluble cytochrome b562
LIDNRFAQSFFKPTSFMKIRLLLLAALLVTFAPPCLRAEEAKKQPREETDLEGKMHKMSGAFRKLKRLVTDASKNADSLQLVATMQSEAAEALKLVPAKADDLPAADRAKFVSDYQTKMKSLIETLEKLETALKANKNDEAAKLVGDLSTLQKAGHKEFKRPDPDEK